MKKKYLPSKKFVIIASIIVLLLIIVLIILNKKDEKGISLAAKIGIAPGPEATTISALVQKDTDTDGIPDWEENLWGTDPNDKSTNGDTPDALWIKQQKSDLPVKEEEAEENTEENLTETEKFSREFFATVNALKQSGNLDQSTVSNISNVVGDKLTDANLPENYSVINIKKTYDVTKESQARFYTAIQDLFEKYSEAGLGDEFDFIDPSLGTADAEELIIIGEAYQAFAKEMAELSIPSNLTSSALDIINSAYNTGVAVENLAKMDTDPLVGLIGLSQYQKYSEQLIESSEELRTYLINSDIIEG